MSNVVGKKANRFFSRRLAELNEVRSKSTVSRDLDPELQESIGKEIADRHEISEEIKLQAKDAEDLRESLKNIYKSALPIAQLLGPFADAVRTHNKWEAARRVQAVQAFADHMEPGQATDSLRAAMSNTVRLQEALIAGLEEMTKGLDSLVIQPQQNFVKKDVRDARYFSHEVLKAQVDYEGAVTRLNKVKQMSKIDAKKYNQAFAELGQFRAKFDQVAIDAQTKFAHMHESNAVDNAAHQLQYLALLAGIFHRGSAICGEFSSSIEQSERDVQGRRGERDAREGVPVLAHATGNNFESNNSLSAIPEHPGKPVTIEGAYADVLALLTRPDARVVSSLSTLLPEEEKGPLVQSVSRILQQTGTFTLFLGGVLQAENAAAAPVTASADGSPVWVVRPVFESEPTVAALVADFFKAHGVYYAQNVLRPILRNLSKEPKALELHPKKVSGEELQANANRLKKYIRDVSEAIFESSVIAPLSVRQLSQDVLRASAAIQQASAVKRDPKADVASLLFFHLFIPALVHPDEYGILTPDLLTPSTKRNLYLLSLALRGVARRSKADEKSGEEWFLGPVDDAVLQSAENLLPYISTMSGEDAPVDATAAPTSFEDKFPVALRQQDIDPLVARLDKNLLQLTPIFAQTGATDLIISVGEVLQAFQTLHGNRGAVAAAPRASGAPTGTPIKSAPDSWNDDD